MKPRAVTFFGGLGAAASSALSALVMMGAEPSGYVNCVYPPGYSLGSFPLRTGMNLNGSLDHHSLLNGVSLFCVRDGRWTAINWLGGWSKPEQTLELGEGWTLYNPYWYAFTLTHVGAVAQGSLTNRLPAGLSLCASMVPQSGLVSATLRYPADVGDKLFLINPTNGQFQAYSFDGHWTPAEPSIPVGGSFWIDRPQAGDWTRPFTVQPPVPSGWILTERVALTSTIPQINFFTFYREGASEPVRLAPGGPPLDENYFGQIYAGLAANQLRPVGAPVHFGSGPAAGYINGDTVDLPFVTNAAAYVYVQLRGWRAADGDSYESAVARGSPFGQSPVITLLVASPLRPAGPGPMPPNFNRFAPFHLLAQPAFLPTPQRTAAGFALAGTAPADAECLIEAASNLSPPDWQPAGSTTANATGEFLFVDAAPQTANARFYRLTLRNARTTTAAEPTTGQRANSR